MQLPEQRLWAAMKSNLKKRHASELWLSRIENSVSSGMPDVVVVSKHTAKTSFVELKATKRPLRETSRLLKNGALRTAQINWHIKAAQFGAESWLLVRDNDLQLYLAPGRLIVELEAASVSEWGEFASSWPDVAEALK